MTYHRTDHFLHCHLWISNRLLKSVGIASLWKYEKGHGTQRIEDVVESVMPKRARIVRVDADVMTKKPFS